jgi:hypothetical protein
MSSPKPTMLPIPITSEVDPERCATLSNTFVGEAPAIFDIFDGGSPIPIAELYNTLVNCPTNMK